MNNILTSRAQRLENTMQEQLLELNSIESSLMNRSSHTSTGNRLQEAYSILENGSIRSEIQDVRYTINTNLTRMRTFRSQL